MRMVSAQEPVRPEQDGLVDRKGSVEAGQRWASLSQVARAPGVAPVVVAAVVIGLWALVAEFVPPLILPGPWPTLDGLADLARSGVLGPAILTSLREMYVGLAIAALAGVTIGILIGVSDWLDTVILPYINIFNAVPGIILIPVFVIWLGAGTVTHTWFVVLIAFFPIVINVRAGMRSAANRYQELGRVFNLSRRSTVLKLIFPASVPYLLTGLKISMGLALIGMIVSEIEVSFSGLGYLLVNLGSTFQTAQVIGLVLLSSAIGVVQVGLVRIAETRLLPWLRWA